MVGLVHSHFLLLRNSEMNVSGSAVGLAHFELTIRSAKHKHIFMNLAPIDAMRSISQLLNPEPITPVQAKLELA